MSNSKPTEFFSGNASKTYDEKNRQLAPISDCLHFLTRLVLKGCPVRSRVLCVGVGTGAEVLALSKAFPEWTFVGVDPSAGMLDVCRERLRGAGVLDRCELIEGYVHDVQGGENFDVALSFLVSHFIENEARSDFFQAMSDRLRPNGYLINAEISFDLDSKETSSMEQNWERIQSLMGATPESLASLPRTLREVLNILPPTETERLLRQSGIDLPVRFFQAFMICGWYGVKVTSRG